MPRGLVPAHPKSAHRIVQVACEMSSQLTSVDGNEDIDDGLALDGIQPDSDQNPDRERSQPRVAQPIGHRFDREFAMLGYWIAEDDSVAWIGFTGLAEKGFQVAHGLSLARAVASSSVENSDMYCGRTASASTVRS